MLATRSAVCPPHADYVFGVRQARTDHSAAIVQLRLPQSGAGAEILDQHAIPQRARSARCGRVETLHVARMEQARFEGDDTIGAPAPESLNFAGLSHFSV